MSFDQVWKNRIDVLMEGLRVSFISKADLVENKRQLGRLRDLADIEELNALPDESL